MNVIFRNAVPSKYMYTEVDFLKTLKQMLAVYVFYTANVQFPDILFIFRRIYYLVIFIFIYKIILLKIVSVIYFIVSEINILTKFVRKYAILS